MNDKDFYVAKLDPTGKTLLMSTYIGGSGDDIGGSFVIASDGAIYIAGETTSNDFPLVNQASSTRSPPAFNGVTYSTTLTKLSADGSKILYSTLLGGGLSTEGDSCCRDGAESSAPGSVAVGANGIAYLIGFAETATEGSAYGTFIDQKGGDYNAGDGSFLAKFDTTQSGAASLLFARTYGLPQTQRGISFNSMAMDSNGNIWITGAPTSFDTIAPTPDALQSICATGDPNNCNNLFLEEMDSNGGVIYATYFGGMGGGEIPTAIFIDTSDNIYLTGTTGSSDFPVKNAAYPTLPGTGSEFLTKLAAGGKSILYSTFAYTQNPVVTATPGGISALAGTQQYGAPVVNGTSSVTITNDAYYEVFDTTKSGAASLLTSSYLGAPGGFTFARAATFDSQGDLLFGGYTYSSGLPVVNPYQATCNANCSASGGSSSDGFVTRVQLAASVGLVTLVPTTQSFPGTAIGATSAAMTSTLTNTTSSAFVFTPSFTDSKDFRETDTCNGMVTAGSTCTFSFMFVPQSAGLLSSTFTLTGTSTLAPLTVGLSGTSTGLAAFTLAPSTYSFGSVTAGSTPVTETLALKNSGSVTDNSVTFQFAETDQGTQTHSLSYTDNCTSLAVGATCNIVVTFTPNAGVSATGTLTVSGDTDVSPVVATITGTAPAIGPPTGVLAPNLIAFGAVTDGTTSPTQTAMFTNTGTASFRVSTVTASNAAIQVISTGCTIVAPGAACQLSVVAAPSIAGSFTGTITISYYSGDGTVAANNLTAILNVTGTGAAAPVPTLSPATLSFGSVFVGSTSPAQLLTLTNTTTSTIAALQGITTPAQFGYAVGGTCGNTLAAGASCTIAVVYQPTSVGVVSGTFSVGTGATAATAMVTGTGTAGPPAFTPASVNFGSIVNGSSTPFTTLTLHNPGSNAVSFTIASANVYPNGPFVFSQGTCGSALAAGASCTYFVLFLPSSVGSFSGGAVATFADGSTAKVAFMGTATPSIPLTITPGSLNFGSVPAGATSTQTLTITNSNPAALNFSAAFTGRFKQDNGCTTTVPANGTCAFPIQFQSATLGPVTGTVTFYFSDGSSQTITLIGTGVLQQLTFTPANVDFGQVDVGSFTVPVTLHITNPGPLLAATVAGLNVNGPFTLVDTECAGNTIAVGATCTFSYLFNPTSAGSYNDNVVVTFAGGSTATANLTGTAVLGTPPTVAPGSANFGSVSIGTEATLPVTLTNTNAGPLTVTSNTATGPFLAGFNCNPVPAKGSCITSLFFQPVSIGSFTGTATYGFSDGSYVTIALIGTGTPANDFSIAATPASQTVTAGYAAPYTLTVTPSSNGFTQPITFSATGLPAGATVQFFSSPVTPGSTPALVVMDVLTAVSKTENTRRPLLPLTAPITAGVLLLFPWVRRRRILTSLFGVLILMGISISVIGCGVNSSSNATVGTVSTITVTATSGSIQHITTVILSLK